MRTLLCALLSGLLFNTAVSAQTEPDTVVALPGIVILDSLGGVNFRDGVATRVISANRISVWPGASLSDLLGAESFALVRQFGSTGYSAVSLRGSGSEHTLILLDGVALADPQSGRLDLSTVPISFLESVTISPGAGHNSGGQGALGGTIELRSLAPTAQPFFRAMLLSGAFGRIHGGAVLSRSIGPAKALIALDLSEYTADFPYTDPSSFPPETVRRTGAERSGTNVFTRVSVASAFGDWDASLWRTDIRRGVPGPSNAPPRNAKQIDRATRFRITNIHRINRGSVTLQLAVSEISLDFFEAESSPEVSLQRSDTHSDSRAVNLQVRATRAVSRFFMLEAKSLIRNERSSIRGGKRQSHGTLDISSTYDNTLGRLATLGATLGASLVVWNDGLVSETRLLPRASVRIVPAGFGGFSIRSSAGRVFRTPSFSDRYWLPGGNPDLLPEAGWTADTGLDLRFASGAGSVELSATAFWSSLRDKIVWHPSLAGSQIRVWRPDNVGKVVGYGAESSVDFAWRTGASTRLAAVVLYTYTRSEDRTDPGTRSYGHQLRYVPRQVLKARLTFESRSVTVEAVSEWVSERYTSSDERFPLPGYRVLMLRAGRNINIFGGDLAALFVLENALNEDIEHIRFYPMPPRHLRFSLRYTINKIKSDPS